MIELCRSVWKEDQHHGVGYKRYYAKQGGDDGVIEYRGEFRGNRRHGRGVAHMTSGDVYDGGFEEGKRHGWGRMEYRDGSVYEGDWQRGARHGTGSWVFFSEQYTGGWLEDLPSGCGVWEWENLEERKSHVGSYLKGDRHGEGVYTESNISASGAVVDLLEMRGVWSHGVYGT